MAKISITNFQDFLLSKVGGKPLSKVQNFYPLLSEAMLRCKAQVDFPSSIRTIQLTNPIYSDVNFYPLPSDISLNAIINLRQQPQNTNYYDFTNMNARQALIENKFNWANNNGAGGGVGPNGELLPATPGDFQRVNSPRLAIRYKNGVPYLFVDVQTTGPVLINPCSSLTENGTIAARTDTTGVAIDMLQMMSQNGSVTFNPGIGTDNGITITGMQSVDLSGQLVLQGYVYIPSLTYVTAIELQYGTDGSNYYSAQTNTDFFGNALQVGWNFLSIPIENFSATGTPDWSDVTYGSVAIIGNFLVAQEGFNVDTLVGNFGALFELDYYSDANFQSVTGVFKERPTTDTDYILLTTADEQNLFLNQMIEIITLDLKQSGATTDFQGYGGARLQKEYEDFRIKYPSQRQLVITEYHNRPRLGWL
jgi:hypothetical protein